MQTRAVLFLSAISLAACGSPGAGGGSGGQADASMTGPEMPDAAPGDAMPPPDPDPWPHPAQPGQFAGASFIAGLHDQIVMATASDHTTFIAGTQQAEIHAGAVDLAAPTHAAIAVLKLAADGTPLWGRSFDGADRMNLRAIAATADGDVVIAGMFAGAGFDLGKGALPNAGGEDGFVARLAGTDGATTWAEDLGSTYDDALTSIATTGDQIYVYGSLGGSGSFDGKTLAAGAVLARLDHDGHAAWAKSLAGTSVSWQGSLVVDPARGPVIAGNFSGSITIGDQTLTVPPDEYDHEDIFLAGFDPDGNARFARAIRHDNHAYSLLLGLADSGDLYLATDGEVTVDDHTVWGHQYDVDLIRLTPDGHYTWSTNIDTIALYGGPRALVVDATGAVTVVGECSKPVPVQPTRPCTSGDVIASYGPDNRYRWATTVDPAWVEAIAAGVAGHLQVAGENQSEAVSFGDVSIKHTGFFLADLVSGIPPAPSPLPPAPTISKASFAGFADHELHHGDTATLVIEGTGLDTVTSARLGDLDLHVEPTSATRLELVVAIPHGYPTGALSLALANAGGTATYASAVIVTPYVISPYGSSTGRATYASPATLCNHDWYLQAKHSDVMLLQAGTHKCNHTVSVASGMIIRGEGRTKTTITGDYGQPFGGFSNVGRNWPTTYEDLAIENASLFAIQNFQGDLVVHRIDVRNGGGIHLFDFYPGRATLYDYNYTGAVAAVSMTRGDLDATKLAITTDGTGISAVGGTVRIIGSSISAAGEGIKVGDRNNYYLDRVHTVIDGSSITANRGVDAFNADLEVHNTSVGGPAGPNRANDGVVLDVGSLLLDHVTIHDVDRGVGVLDDLDSSSLDRSMVVSVNDSTIDGGHQGISMSLLYGGADSRLSVRTSKVTCAGAALWLYGELQTVDLGTAGAPGGNALTSSASDGFPIVDNRSGLNAIDAHGTTLNGATLTGTVIGPATLAGRYQLVGPTTLRF